MDTAVTDYLMDCAVRLSPKTQRWYEGKLLTFQAWCDREGLTLDQIKTPTVNRFIRQLQTTTSESTGKALTTYTVHGYAQVIFGFLRWAGKNGYTTLSIPPGTVDMPKVQQKVIEVFSVAQLKQMIAACSQEENPRMAQRDRAILYFLLDTGVRANELCTMKLDDLHIQEGWARVLGKGNKEREVAFGNNARYHLVKYLRRYRKAAPGVETVFTSRRSEPMTVSGLDQMLYRLGEWAGITGVRVSAHTFRHTFAVNYLARGGDVYALSRTLGHTSVSTTEIYLRAAKDRELRRNNASVADKLLLE